ncbi:GNAT family N-acetyltransferase [Wukongibacter baidiensis]|uniref:GNAT family N-acetyltransferase n=1 Tax=Wukongibacter baidiensis TaxID=1723361 RepID=UPI003D7FFFD0
MYHIREIDEGLSKEIGELIKENWGSPVMISRGQVHYIDKLPGYVMMEDNKIIGLITYNIKDNECEIVSLDSWIGNKGIGSKLISKVIERSEALGCSRLWLITTNDNTRAIKFYQKRGFNISGLYLNSIVRARKIKPEIPLFGYDNIPILHEIEFEMILSDEGIKSNLSLSYNHKADYREKSEIQTWKISEINKFLSYMRKEEKVNLLDLGAGAGKQAEVFKDNDIDVTCIDISKEMVRLCKDRNLKAYIMDFYNLVFGNETFDAAWSMNTLLHVPKNSIGKVLKNINRVLKPDGIFYFGLYGGHKSEGIWEADFYNPKRFFAFYEDDEIKEIVKNDFKIIEFDTIPMGKDKPYYQSFILRKK